MTEPAFAVAAGDLAQSIKHLDEFELAANVATDGLIATVDAARAALTGTLAKGADAALVKSRQRAAETVSRVGARALLVPHIQQIGASPSGVVIESPGINNNDLTRIRRDVYDAMVGAAQTVDSLNMTFGTPAFSGTGDGEVRRLLEDETGLDLEGWFPDDYSLEVVIDGRKSGEPELATFQLSGTVRAPDNLEILGTGLIGPRLVALSSAGADAGRFVSNPSWDQVVAPDPLPSIPTSLPGWSTVSGVLTNLLADSALIFRATPGVPAVNQRSIFFGAGLNDTLYQNMVLVRRAVFDEDTAYDFGVAVYRQNSADGSLIIRLTDVETDPTAGGQSVTVNVATLANNAWTWVWLQTATGQANWFRNFNLNNLGVSFQRTGGTVGEVGLDSIAFAPFTRVGAYSDEMRGRGAMGQGLLVRGGPTPYVLGDKFTWTDADNAARAEINFWFRYADLGYLPHTTGVPTIPEA